MNRRELIAGIGRAICAGYSAPFLPYLLPQEYGTMTSRFLGYDDPLMQYFIGG